MLRRVIPTAVLVITCLIGCGDDRLGSIRCSTPCYSGPPHTLGIGTCQAGQPVCDERHNLTGCNNEILPSPEICDGLDNDCNGKVDDDLLPTTHGNETVGTPCGSTLGACSPGTVKCASFPAALYCSGAVLPQEEDCSGRDLDCDGVIDNIKAQICYDGNPADLLPRKSECRAGVLGCSSGHVVCLGEILPQVETCSDTTDRNCDGIVGDGAGYTPTDLVFVLNHDDVLLGDPSIIVALISFANRYTAATFRYTIIEVPGSTGWTTMALNAGDSTDFLNYFAGPTLLASYGATEYPMVAFYDVATNSYGIKWQPNSIRYLIWFGDDNDCSIYDTLECENGVPLYSPDTVTTALQSAGIVFVSFADATPDYPPIALATGGFSVYLIGLDSTMIEADLSNLVAPNCQ